MGMHNWGGYRAQVMAGVSDLAKLSPDTVRGYATLSGAGSKTVHLDAVREFGATREDLAEAPDVAVSVNAGAALVYSTRMLDAFGLPGRAWAATVRKTGLHGDGSRRCGGRIGPFGITMEQVMLSLQGKRAFITGASRGIGVAIARRFAAEGAAVAVGYERSADAAHAIAREIEAVGGRAVTIQMDASNPASIEQAVSRAASELCGLDILVNNAGIIRYGSAGEIALEDIDATLAVNVRAVILATQAALPHKSDGGRIITTGSNLAERMPDAGKALYSASKADLVALTKGFARDLGPRGITVNLVHPGSTDTDMNPADGPHAEAQRQRMAIKKYGRAEGVAAFYAFIASSEARSVTGTGFTVDGGANA